MRIPRYLHSATSFKTDSELDEKILVVGGFPAGSDDGLCCSAEIYSPGSDTWTKAGALPIEPAMLVNRGRTPIFRAKLLKFGTYEIMFTNNLYLYTIFDYYRQRHFHGVIMG
jgi:hypothetical protein